MNPKSNGPSPVRILFEDDELLVLDKPSGILVVPTPRGEKNTLSALADRMMRQRQPSARAFPCHRLDRETSGVIVFVKTRAAEEAVRKQFHAQEIHKTYRAFASGTSRRQEGEISGMISTEPPYFGRGVRGGEFAHTRYRLVEQRKGFWVAEVEPLTGRTNQIRIHFKQLGHPILGDRKYAFGRDFAVRFRRVALHAAQITLSHPRTGKVVSFTAPLPEDMQTFLRNPPSR